MQIERIEIRNYRAFRHAVLNDLPPMTVVVGANDSDKSTFFDVFSFLKDALTQNVATVTTFRLFAQSASNFRAASQGLVLFFQLGFQDRIMSEFITTLTLENAIAAPINGGLTRHSKCSVDNAFTPP